MSRQTREQLGVKPGDSIIIKGDVTFARLDKLVEGEALMAENKRRQGINMIPSDKPFRSVSIDNLSVVKGQDTPLAKFHGQEVYPSKATGNQTMTLETKSLFPPSYGHLQNNVIVEIPDPQKNPATGQTVYIKIDAFKPKNFNNMGSAFTGIIFDEGEIKFYEAGNSLAGFGQALGLEVQEMTAQTAPVAETQGFGAPTQEPVQEPVNTGFGGGFGEQVQTQHAQSAPVQEPVQAPANPFGVQDSQVADTAGAQPNPFGGAPANNPNPFA